MPKEVRDRGTSSESLADENDGAERRVIPLANLDESGIRQNRCSPRTGLRHFEDETSGAELA